jgi:hypothetical protein
MESCSVREGEDKMSRAISTDFKQLALRVGTSLLSYLASAFVLSLFLLCCTWTPLRSATPMMLYGQAYAFIVWLCGVWALSATIPSSLQLRDWRLTIATSALHALLIAGVVYWFVYGRSKVASQLDWHTLFFFGLMGLGGLLAGSIYFYVTKRFLPQKHFDKSGMLGLRNPGP